MDCLWRFRTHLPCSQGEGRGWRTFWLAGMVRHALSRRCRRAVLLDRAVNYSAPISDKRMNLLRDGVNPPLPDYEAEEVTPHPDGRAWRKGCQECALRTHDPQNLGDNYQRSIARGSPGAFFYCVHRTDGGFNRICGCYAALHRL